MLIYSIIMCIHEIINSLFKLITRNGLVAGVECLGQLLIMSPLVLWWISTSSQILEDLIVTQLLKKLPHPLRNPKNLHRVQQSASRFWPEPAESIPYCHALFLFISDFPNKIVLQFLRVLCVLHAIPFSFSLVSSLQSYFQIFPSELCCVFPYDKGPSFSPLKLRGDVVRSFCGHRHGPSMCKGKIVPVLN
jgi:hypothetical protein